MKLKNLSKVELEAMSYDDIAYQILVEGKKKMKINDLFKKGMYNARIIRGRFY